MHAELLLKQGFGAKAVALYEQLVARYPDSLPYRARLEEVRGFLGERQTSLPEPRSRPPEVELRSGPAELASRVHETATRDLGGDGVTDTVRINRILVVG